MTDEDPYDDDEGFPEKAEEMCFEDENGQLQDAEIHGAMLDNKVAEANFQAMVYKQAIESGMSPELAQKLYLDGA